MDTPENGAAHRAQTVLRLPVALDRCTQLLGHGPLTLVTSAHGGQRNVMAASWAMPLDFNPPKMIVIIDASTLTRRLVDASGEFGLQVPTRAIAAQTLAAGSLSGSDGDKFARCGLGHFAAQIIQAPMVEGCAAWLECRVIDDGPVRMDIILGEVVAAYADASIYSDNRWHFGDDPLKRTLHYVAGGQFFVTGESFQVPAKPAH